MNVFVLMARWHFEGEEFDETLGVFTEFPKMAERATADERKHAKVRFNVPQYSAQEFMLDGGHCGSYLRYANGQWAARCVACGGVGVFNKGTKNAQVCTGCKGESYVKLASEEARRAYVSAAREMITCSD